MASILSKLNPFSNKSTSAPPPNVVPFPSSAGGGPAPVGPVTSEAILEATMQEAMSMTEVYEPVLAKGVHAVYSWLAYTLPFVAAIFAGWWIGDGYAGAWQWNGESAGVHVISLTGEITLGMITVACAIVAKQATSDTSRRRTLMIGIAILLFFSAASATAQWFLILHNVQAAGYDPSSAGVLAMLFFRVLMPLGVDVGALYYLAVYGHKSLKHRLAQLDQRAEAFEKLHARKLAMQAAEDKARREREDAEAERERRRRAEELVTRIQEINSQATLAAIEQHMLKPGIVDADVRQQRRGSTY